jgi:hypothetical protein
VLRLSAAVVLLFCVLPVRGFGQKSEPPNLTLGVLTRESSLIFAGRVNAIDYVASKSPNHLPTVSVTFQVDKPFRGTRNGTLITIREWAGLWNEGERYRVGERVLLFLHPPSKLGLTSPVGGRQGRFSVDKQGYVLMSLERARRLGSGKVLRPSKGRIRLEELSRAIRKFQTREN